MTSNLPVAGVDQGVSGQLAGTTRTSMYGAVPFGESTGAEFARVLAAAQAERATAGSSGAPALLGELDSVAASRLLDSVAGRGEVGAGAEAGELALGERLMRALLQDEPRAHLAAPLVHRAVDAYRELMNVSV